MSDQVRVLIADDHPMFRNEHRPDVVVMDLQRAEMNGIDATRAIAEAQPGVRVRVLTMGEEDDLVLAAMRAGARGYLIKGLAPKTVRNNVSNTLAKLQATDRSDAIIRARDAGLGGGA